jgi:hypothetical protein
LRVNNKKHYRQEDMEIGGEPRGQE